MKDTLNIISGIQPSGKIHFGNYFGMIKPALSLQEKGDTFYFIANLHAITTVHNPQLLSTYSKEMAIDFLACGLDPSRSSLFLQSSVPSITELSWILATITPTGLLERCHAFKDKIANGYQPSLGIFSYPVLMAADILAYNTDLVPVGKDQQQHLEITRDIAIKFNTVYGNTFKLPKALFQEESNLILGLDGLKMSKSYRNTIPLFLSETELRKKIMSIKTDSAGIHESKSVEKSIILSLYRHVASSEDYLIMEDQFRSGGIGYGTFKKTLFHQTWEYFYEIRKKRQQIEKDEIIDDILREGSKKANIQSELVISRVHEVIGIP